MTGSVRPFVVHGEVELRKGPSGFEEIAAQERMAYRKSAPAFLDPSSSFGVSYCLSSESSLH